MVYSRLIGIFVLLLSTFFVYAETTPKQSTDTNKDLVQAIGFEELLAVENTQETNQGLSVQGIDNKNPIHPKNQIKSESLKPVVNTDDKKLAPTYLPFDKIQFKQPQNYKVDYYDRRDNLMREAIIEKLEKEELWPVGTFVESRKALTNLMPKYSRPTDKRLHSEDFYESLESAIINKLSRSGGFQFQECISECEERIKVIVSEEKMVIRQRDMAEDFLKKQTAEKKVDGILKWNFITLDDRATLDVRLISVNNQILWQDYITVGKKEIEIERKQEIETLKKLMKEQRMIQLRGHFSIKSQDVTFNDLDNNESFSSSLLLVLNYGIKGKIYNFKDIRYQLSTRIQVNTEQLDNFVYFLMGIDSRLGYNFYEFEGNDSLIFYVVYFQDLALVAGRSTGLALEWTLSDDYFLTLGYEQPLDNERHFVTGNNFYEIGDAIWLEAGINF